MKTFDGYKKRNLTDDNVLLAGGGHKSITDLLSPLGDYLPLRGGTMKGQINMPYGTAISNGSSNGGHYILAWRGDNTCVGSIHGPTYVRSSANNLYHSNNASGNFLIYDSGNSNKSTINWTTKDLTVAGTIYALGLGNGTSDVTDTTEFITSNVNGLNSNDWQLYHRPVVKLYNYLKGKFDSLYNNYTLPARLGPTQPSVNIDTVDELGFYQYGFGTLPSNCISGHFIMTRSPSGYRHLLYFKSGGAGVSGTSYDSADIYHRAYNNTSSPSWTDWNVLLSSANFHKYALPLTGGTLTGDLLFKVGIGINTENNGYTFIRHDGSNNIIGTNGHATYIRSSGDNLYHTSSNVTSLTTNAYKIFDEHNYTTWINTTNFPGLLNDKVKVTVSDDSYTNYRPLLAMNAGGSATNDTPSFTSTIGSVIGVHRIYCLPSTGNLFLYSPGYADSPALVWQRGEFGSANAYDWKAWVSGGNLYFLWNTLGGWRAHTRFNYSGSILTGNLENTGNLVNNIGTKSSAYNTVYTRYISSPTDYTLRFKAGGTEVFNLTPSGNATLGSGASDLDSYKLLVTGTTKLISDNFGESLIIHRNHTTYAATVLYSNNGGIFGYMGFKSPNIPYVRMKDVDYDLLHTGNGLLVDNTTTFDFINTTPQSGSYILANLKNPVSGNNEYGNILTLNNKGAAGYYTALLVISSVSGADSKVHAYIRRLTNLGWSPWSTILDNNNFTSILNLLYVKVLGAGSYNPAGAYVRPIVVDGSSYDFWSPYSSTGISITTIHVNLSQTTTSNWRPVVLGGQNTTKSNAALYSSINSAVYTTNILQYLPSSGTLSSTYLEATGAVYLKGSKSLVYADGDGTNVVLWVDGIALLVCNKAENAVRRGTAATSTTLGTATYQWPVIFGTRINTGAYNYTGWTSGLVLGSDGITNGIAFYTGSGTTGRIYRLNNYLVLDRGGTAALRINTSCNTETRSLYPAANHTYNLGTLTNVYEHVYTRYVDTDSASNGYDLRLCTGGKERAHITGNTGNLVVGKSDYDPGTKFAVVGTSSFEDAITIFNNKQIFWKDTGGTARTVLSVNSNNAVNLAYGMAGAGFPTYINGNTISFNYGTSHVQGMQISAIGNVGIGTYDASLRLVVVGTTKLTSDTWGTQLIIYRNHASYDSVIQYANKSGTLGYIGVSDNNAPKPYFATDSSVYYLVHSGNYTSYLVNNKTELKVSNSSNTSLRPLLFGLSYSSGNTPTFSAVTDYVYQSHKIWIHPANGWIYADRYIGKYNAHVTLMGATGYGVQIIADGGRTDELRNVALTADGAFRPFAAATGKITLGTSSYYWGKTYASAFYATSDIRLKTIKSYINITINSIAKLPIFDFTWVDGTEGIHSGTSAQAVQEILPNLVSGDDKLTLNYSVLGTVVGITACRELVNQKSELEQLKERVIELEKQLNEYRSIRNSLGN